MGTIRRHQAVVVGVLMLIFIAMALEATTFRQVASYFPLYTSIAGALISLLIVVTGVLRSRQERKSQAMAAAANVKDEPVAQADDDGQKEQIIEEATAATLLRDRERQDIQNYYAGMKWFAAMAGFVFLVVLIGLTAASLILVSVWFRTIYRWKFIYIAAALAGVGSLLWLARNVVDMPFPSGALFSIT